MKKCIAPQKEKKITRKFINQYCSAHTALKPMKQLFYAVHVMLIAWKQNVRLFKKVKFVPNVMTKTWLYAVLVDKKAINKRKGNTRIIENICESCEDEHLYKKHIDELNVGTANALNIAMRQLKLMRTIPLMSRLRKSYRESDDENKAPFDVLKIDMFGFYLVVV